MDQSQDCARRKRLLFNGWCLDLAAVGIVSRNDDSRLILLVG